MLKKLLEVLSPLLLLYFSGFLLWLALQGVSGSSMFNEQASILRYFVNYVFYFSLILSVVHLMSSACLVMFGRTMVGKVVSSVLRLPVTIYTLSVGGLCFAVAFNVSLFVLAPSLLYFFTAALLVRQDYLSYRKI